MNNNLHLVVHSSVNGHLSHFQLLDVVTNATMDFPIKFLCVPMFSFLLGIYLGVELLDHMIILCLTI